MYSTTSFGPEQKIKIDAYKDDLTSSSFLILEAQISSMTEASFNRVTISATSDQLRQIADEIYRAFPVELSKTA
jgi:hypothetical protein